MLKTTNWFFGERERERKRNGEESDIVILEFLFLSLMKEYFEFIGFQFNNTFEVKFVVQIMKFLDCYEMNVLYCLLSNFLRMSLHSHITINYLNAKQTVVLL